MKVAKEQLAGVALVALAAALSCACGDVADPEYFQQEVDPDVGQDNGDDPDAGTSAVTGDPCADDNPWGCDPVTNAGCQAQETACEYGVHQGASGFYCFSDSTEPLGAACGSQDNGGPWCAGGSTCVSGICVAYCCGDDDCGGEVCSAVEHENVTGPLGTCPPEQDLDTDLDAGPDPDGGELDGG